MREEKRSGQEAIQFYVVAGHQFKQVEKRVACELVFWRGMETWRQGAEKSEEGPDPTYEAFELKTEELDFEVEKAKKKTPN